MPRKKKDIKLITLDTETLGFEGSIKRIAMYDGVEIFRGYCFKDLLPQLEEWQKEYQLEIYVHNLDFDLRKMPEIWTPGNVKWTKTKIILNKYALVSCQHYNIHDSYRLLPFSLDSLSKDFEVSHAKKDLMSDVRRVHGNKYKDKEDFFINCDKDDPVYIEYLDYDVISLYEILQKVMQLAKIDLKDFIKIISTASLSRYLFKNGHGDKKFTTPGQTSSDFEILCSMKYWETSKKFPYSNTTYKELEYKIRDSYCGGRTEVFKPILEGDGKNIKGFHYDVNSLYPSVMINNEYPIGFPSYDADPVTAELMFEQWQLLKTGLGFITCELFIPFQHIPPLPLFIEKLCFTTGYVKGTFTYIELDYAIKNCGAKVIKYYDVIHFKHTFPVFHNFVEHFYKMKEDASRIKNNSLKNFAKLVLNVGYGYTGMNRDDKTVLDYIENSDKYGDRLIQCDEELGFCESWAIIKAQYIQPQIASYVTSYARLVLLDALRKQYEVGEVYYCDTDSIVCEKPLPAEMVDEYEIGKWALEKELYSGIFLQPKVYYEETTDKETIKFKGVTKKAQEGMKRETYENIYSKLCDTSEERLLLEENVSSLPSLVVAQKNNRDWNTLNIRDKYLNLNNKQKRNIDYKKNKSEPWHMSSIEVFETFSFRTKKLKLKERRQ